MPTNVYKKFQNVRLIQHLLSLPLSFTALFFVYLIISLIGYSHYGLRIFGYQWSDQPTPWQEMKALWQHAFGWTLTLLSVLGVFIDLCAWPYFFRFKSAQLERDHAPVDSEAGSDRTSEV